MQEGNVQCLKSSTESEIISLDAGLRVDGIPAVDLWDEAIEVMHSSNNRKSSTQGAAGHCALTSSSGRPLSKRKGRRASTGKPSTRRNPEHKYQNGTEMLNNCQTGITFAQTQVLLNVNRSCRFSEDNEAVIKMIIKGRNPTMSTRVKNSQSRVVQGLRQASVPLLLFSYPAVLGSIARQWNCLGRLLEASHPCFDPDFSRCVIVRNISHCLYLQHTTST